MKNKKLIKNISIIIKILLIMEQRLDAIEKKLDTLIKLMNETPRGSPKTRAKSKKAAKVEKGAANPLTTKVGSISKAQCEEIAKAKEPDLTAGDLEAAVRTIAGSARSMGITVEGV